MEEKSILLCNMHKIHTTDMGKIRIRRNLKLEDDVNVLEYCKNKIANDATIIYRRGKNWYCLIDGMQFTINAYSYTIITAHFVDK